MKSKIIIFLVSCGIGITSSLACGHSECGGGPDQCCKDFFGAMYYCKAAPPKLAEELE